MISRKNRKFSTAVNYIEHVLILTFSITGCISISAFASLCGIPVGTTSSEIELKICAIAAGIRKVKSIIKKKKKDHDKIVLLAKSKLNSIEFVISKPLMDQNIIHDEFILINDVLKEYDDMRVETKLKT